MSDSSSHSFSHSDLPWLHWRQLVHQPDINHDLQQIYTDLSTQIAARGPQCWASGRCCHFNSFGHRLYVTGLEIAWVLHHTLATHAQHLIPPAFENLDGCPFQISHICDIHAYRPLGCRIFFCQQGTDVWQHQLYESFLARLRLLHEEKNIPYHYIEWRFGLAQAVAAFTSQP